MARARLAATQLRPGARRVVDSGTLQDILGAPQVLSNKPPPSAEGGSPEERGVKRPSHAQGPNRDQAIPRRIAAYLTMVVKVPSTDARCWNTNVGEPKRATRIA